MLSKANVLVLDDPTNHLDLESITALNDGLMGFTGSILFASHDHQFIQTLANRIIAISDKGVVLYNNDFRDFLWHKVCEKSQKKKLSSKLSGKQLFFVIQVSLVHPFLAKGEDSDTT